MFFITWHFALPGPPPHSSSLTVSPLLLEEWNLSLPCRAQSWTVLQKNTGPHPGSAPTPATAVPAPPFPALFPHHKAKGRKTFCSLHVTPGTFPSPSPHLFLVKDSGQSQKGLRVKRTKVQAWINHMLAVNPWGRYLAIVSCFSKMGRRVLSKMPNIQY